MILKDKSRSAEFFHTVQKCCGEVFFDTDAGDHLNLKSELSQLVFTVIINKLDELNYSITYEKQDEELLTPYLREK